MRSDAKPGAEVMALLGGAGRKRRVFMEEQLFLKRGKAFSLTPTSGWVF